MRCGGHYHESMSKRTLSAALLACLLSAGLNASAGGGGRVLTLPVVTEGPATPCVEKTRPQPKLPAVHVVGSFICYQDDAKTQPGTFVSFSTVEKAIEALGGTVTAQDDGNLTLNLGRSSFPFWPDFRRGGESYTDAQSLLSILARHQPQDANVRVTLRGMDKPEVQVGNTRIRLSDTAGKSIGKGIYNDLASSALIDLYYGARPPQIGFSYETHYSPELGRSKKVPTALRAGEVVTAFALNSENIFQSATAVVDAKGQISLYDPFEARQLRFVTDPHKLTPFKAGQPWPVLLVKMSGTPLNNLKSGLFLPKP